MSLYDSLQQLSLIVALFVSTVGTYIAIVPPNPAPKSLSGHGDLVRRLNLTRKHVSKIAVAPVALLVLHTAIFVYLHPNVPSSPLVLRHCAENGLNADLVTWSPATAIPLALIIFVGVPLRLVPYATLGRNFTFELAEPDRLTTTGIYRFVQHPSYTGVLVLIASNAVLLQRVDGVLGCWIPPQWYGAATRLAWTMACLGTLVLLFPLWTRVTQEEQMLRAKFGAEWEKWHAKTARFVPAIF